MFFGSFGLYLNDFIRVGLPSCFFSSIAGSFGSFNAIQGYHLVVFSILKQLRYGVNGLSCVLFFILCNFVCGVRVVKFVVNENGVRRIAFCGFRAFNSVLRGVKWNFACYVLWNIFFGSGKVDAVFIDVIGAVGTSPVIRDTIFLFCDFSPRVATALFTCWRF